jgi:hypothetical protein
MASTSLRGAPLLQAIAKRQTDRIFRLQLRGKKRGLSAAFDTQLF